MATMNPVSEPRRTLWMRRIAREARWRLYDARNRFYILCEKFLMTVFVRRPLRILISDGPETSPEVTNAVKAGFGHSSRQVEIGPISRESFDAFDLVMPITVSELLQVQQWPSLLSGNPVPIPSKESIQLCDDKYEFSQALIERGFGNCIPMISPELEPPYILKKRFGLMGQECWMIRDREDEARVERHLKDPEFYRQKIVRGHGEFATHILLAKGRIIKSLNIMYGFESDMPIKGKDHVLYTAIHRCPYVDLFGSVLNAIGFEGLCCVNYKVEGGQPYILEINPRFGASLAPYFFSFLRHVANPDGVSSQAADHWWQFPAHSEKGFPADLTRR